MESPGQGELRVSTNGHWYDEHGNQHVERRTGVDRRSLQGSEGEQYKERRKLFRRRVDREILERDHKSMIKEALEDFAAEHGGHL